jgi:proline iminopeptidase
MRISTIIDRFRVYTKSIILLLATVAAGVVLFFSFMGFDDRLVIIAIVWIGLALVGFPFYISKKLDTSSKPLLFALPVAFASIGLLTLKVIVNESAFRSCLDSPPSILNYLWFYCWSSVFLWEVYFVIKTRKGFRTASVKRITFILAPIISLTFTYNSFAQSFPDSNRDGKFYTVNGAKIWTVRFGQGTPIFLIAGGPGGAHLGMRGFDSLSTTNMLIYYDAFGRGRSDTAKDVKEYSLKRDIEDLEELRKAMGFTKIIVLGHSYGSVVAQGYALQYGQNLSHLILSAPFHSNVMWQENDDNYNREIRVNYPEVWDTLMIIRKQGYQSSDSLHQVIYGRIPYGFVYAYNPENFIGQKRIEYPNKFNTRLYYQMVGRDGDFIVDSDIGTFDYRQQLKNLKMPVLILAGRYDRVAVPWMMVQYRQYCPQAQFILFEKSGHNPHVEEPQKTFNHIKAFLNK